MAKLEFERLMALGTERLARLLMELADQDSAIEKRLVVLTATNLETLKTIRAQISGLKRNKRVYDWKSVGKLWEKIELMLQSLGRLEIEPRAGFELVCRFYETDNAVFGHCDDSSGIIGDLYKQNAHDLLIRFGQQCDDKPWLAEKVTALCENNEYGIRDRVLTAASEFLPEAEIRRLINRYCELATEADEKDGSTTESWNHPGRRYWTSAFELAASINDGPLHEMAYRSSWGDNSLNSAGWNSIAEVYLSAGDPKTALKKLENISADQTFEKHKTEELRIAAHQAIGKQANRNEIANIFRERLFASPSVKTLSRLDEYLDASERKLIVDELVSSHQSEQKLDLSFLEFALSALEIKIAESYLLQRSDQIDGDRYYTLAPLAKLFAENDSPLAATLILRALADSILDRANSKNYKIAVGYINRAANRASKISDWQNHIDHNTYLETLRTRHPRKSAFWSKMG